MSKRRKEIRNEIVAILRRAKLVMDESLRSNRSTIYDHKKLPAISVYTRLEDISEELAQAPRLLRKNIDMVIEIVVASDRDDEAADKLDDLCEQVEQHLSSDDSLNDKADDIILQRVDFDFQGENVEKPLHIALMNFKVKYADFAPRDRFLQHLDEMENAGAHYNLNSVQDEDDRAEDILTLEQ